MGRLGEDAAARAELANPTSIAAAATAMIGELLIEFL
jgi:hypothetical protein